MQHGRFPGHKFVEIRPFLFHQLPPQGIDNEQHYPVDSPRQRLPDFPPQWIQPRKRCI